MTSRSDLRHLERRESIEARSLEPTTPKPSRGATTQYGSDPGPDRRPLGARFFIHGRPLFDQAPSCEKSSQRPPSHVSVCQFTHHLSTARGSVGKTIEQLRFVTSAGH